MKKIYKPLLKDIFKKGLNHWRECHVHGWKDDIGKIVIPLKVMNKAKRLDGKEEVLYKRLELIEAYYEIDSLKGNLSNEEATRKK